MSKARFDNSAECRGWVYSHNLQKRTTGAASKNPGQEYIMGDLSIATDDAVSNVVRVHFTYITPTYTAGRNAGQTNPLFTNLEKIINEGKTYENVGEEAERVRIDRLSIDVNDWYNQQGELVSTQRLEASQFSFLHFLLPTEKTNGKASFTADVLINNVVERESLTGSDYLSLTGFVFNFRKEILPVTLTVSSEGGVKAIGNLDISAAEPYFGKVSGNIVSTTVEVEKEDDSSDMMFGEFEVKPTTRTFRSWEIAGMSNPLELTEGSITIEELQKALEDRDVKLADIKARSEANSGNTVNTFPTATTTTSKKISLDDPNDYIPF